MLHDFDRSGYIGASDVRFVMGPWRGKSFENWWLEKLGRRRGHFQNRYTRAGNAWEHTILRSLGIPGMEFDRQFLLEGLKLRVNLDGNTRDTIYEVKTYRLKKGWKPQKWHIWQLQVQMFCSGIPRGEIVTYGLREEDYALVGPVDPGRLQRIPVAYDPAWLDQCFLPRLRLLAAALRAGRFPAGLPEGRSLGT